MGFFLYNVGSLRSTALRTLKKKERKKFSFFSRHNHKGGKGNLESLERKAEFCSVLAQKSNR